MEIESDDPRGATVWSRRPIASYLKDLESTTDADTDHDREDLYLPRPPLTRSPSPDVSEEDEMYGSGSNTEGELVSEARTVEIGEVESLDISDLDDTSLITGEQPSLGLLDEALSFIAAERAKWNAQREAGSNNNGTDSSWKHVIGKA